MDVQRAKAGVHRHCGEIHAEVVNSRHRRRMPQITNANIAEGAALGESGVDETRLDRLSVDCEAALSLQGAELLKIANESRDGNDSPLLPVIVATLLALRNFAESGQLTNKLGEAPSDEELATHAQAFATALEQRQDAHLSSRLTDVDLTDVVVILLASVYRRAEWAHQTPHLLPTPILSKSDIGACWLEQLPPPELRWWANLAHELIRTHVAHYLGALTAALDFWVIGFENGAYAANEALEPITQRLIVGDCPCKFDGNKTRLEKCYTHHNLFAYLWHQPKGKKWRLRDFLQKAIAGSNVQIWKRKASYVSREVALEVDEFRCKSIPSGMYAIWHNRTWNEGYKLKIKPRVSEPENTTQDEHGNRVDVYSKPKPWLVLVPQDGRTDFPPYWTEIPGFHCKSDICEKFVHFSSDTRETLCPACQTQSLRTLRHSHSYYYPKSKTQEVRN